MLWVKLVKLCVFFLWVNSHCTFLTRLSAPEPADQLTLTIQIKFIQTSRLQERKAALLHLLIAEKHGAADVLQRSDHFYCALKTTVFATSCKITIILNKLATVYNRSFDSNHEGNRTLEPLKLCANTTKNVFF